MENEQTMEKHAWETPMLRLLAMDETKSGGVVNTETGSYGPNS